TDTNGVARFEVSMQVRIASGDYLTATATDPTDNTSEFSQPLRFTPVNPVNLSVATEASTNALLLGDQLGYSITAVNSGTNAASGVVVTDWLPASMKYVYAAANQGALTVSSNYVAFDLGTLPAGATATMKIYLSPQSVGLFTNAVSLSETEYNLNSNATAY